MDFEPGLTQGRETALDQVSPGGLGLAQIKDEQDAAKRVEAEKAADQTWRKNNAATRVWGRKDYRFADAYCAGVDLEAGILPNQYFEPGAVNVVGHDLATGNKVKSVVDKHYEGLAFYGAQNLSRSRTSIGMEKPATDVMYLTAIAASMQASGKSYQDFASGLPAWSDAQLASSWKAGTNASRMKELVDAKGPQALIGLYPAVPHFVDFDKRMADPAFQQAAKVIMKSYGTGRSQPVSDQAAAKWLAEHLRDLDWNTASRASIYLSAKDAPHEVHKAYEQALDMWEQTNMEMRLLPQAKNFARGILDPANLWGGAIGKALVVSAGRVAFKDFIKRALVGAAAGGAGGAQEAVAKAEVQGRAATGEEIASKAGEGAAGGAVFNATLPELFGLIGKGASKGIKAFKAAGPEMPHIPDSDVTPRATSSDPVVEISLPRREGDVPLRTAPETPAEPVPITEPVPGEPVPITEPPAPAPLVVPATPRSAVFIDPSTGYFSPIQKAIVESPQKKWGDMNQVMKLFAGKADVKQDELDWIDFPSFLAGKKGVTQEELLDHFLSRQVKILREDLITPRPKTMPVSLYLLENDVEYKRLGTEIGEMEMQMHQALDGMEAGSPEQAAFIESTNADITRLRDRHDAIRDLALKGDPIEGAHGLDIMIYQDPISTRGLVDEISALSRQLNAGFAHTVNPDLAQAGVESKLAQAWSKLQDWAYMSDAIVTPEMVEAEALRPASRYFTDVETLRGGTLPGAEDTFQISTYVHPEGLKAQGIEQHPRGAEPGTLGWALSTQRQTLEGKSVKQIEEVQSDVGNERRGAEKDFMTRKTLGDEELMGMETLDDVVLRDYKKTQGKDAKDLPDHWRELTPQQKRMVQTAPDLYGVASHMVMDELNAIPRALFHTSQAFNILKSEFYNAVKEGHDYFAWPTTRIIQDRWGGAPHSLIGEDAEMWVVPGDARVQLRGKTLNENTGQTNRERTWSISIDTLKRMMPRMQQGERQAAEEMIEAIKKGEGYDSWQLVLNDKPFQIYKGKYENYSGQLVDDMNKFIKRYGKGAKVIKKKIVLPGGAEEVVHMVEITDAMRKRMMKEGVPIGAVAPPVAGAIMAGQQEEETQ